MAVAGVILMNGQTAADEDAGRLEPYLAQPVRRWLVFTGRAAGVVVWLAIIGLVMLAAQLSSDAVFEVDIGMDRILPTVALCTLLGIFHGAVAAAVAGWTGRPGVVLGVGMALAVGGYVAIALFPISDALEPWRHASPWDWALGGDPLASATEAWRYAALGLPSLVIIGLGAWLFGRRDVQAA
jgi:ABC-2 type transport system permease protein